ncbi:hypothetical protein MRS44_005531 [Fusarium solani]|uniref:uncharacterized protein n=1 Tax=Fusarium solani TaxID=169388 RepID=UPI0032C3E89E|nr:hypothetical protein MRS44_005531 [Fusarium solani]
MSVYFEYYSNQTRRFLLDGGRHIRVKAHSDVAEVAQNIITGSTREDLHQKMCDEAPSNHQLSKVDAIDNTINLCASLLLMTEIGQSQIGLSGQTPVRWEGNSLETTLSEHFIPQKALTVDNAKLGKLFTGRNLSRIGGIKIIWTTNLADHLRLTDDDQAVFVFHCTSFLRFQARYEAQCDSPQTGDGTERPKRGLFPAGFINETLHTLALLFPSSDKKTKSWLQAQRKSKKSGNIDPLLGSCGTLRAHDRRFEKFSFWHDRLVIPLTKPNRRLFPNGGSIEGIESSGTRSGLQYWFSS